MRAISSRPYASSVELCRHFGVSRDDYRQACRQSVRTETARKILSESPFFYLTKVLGRLCKDQTRTLQILTGQTPQPLFDVLELFVSANCNVSCSFCYRRDRDYGDQRILSAEEFIAVINEFTDAGGRQLDVSGGLEPLLSPAIAAVFNAGISRGLRVNLYTIGTALHNPKIAEQLMKLSQIRVSFTAHDRASYVKHMGVDHFDRVVENLLMLIRRKSETRSPVGVGTSYVVTPGNFRDIGGAVEFAMSIGQEFFDLRAVSFWEAPDYTTEERAELSSILGELRRKQAAGAHGRLKISIADTFVSVINPAEDPLSAVKPELVNGLLHYRITVTPAGKLFPLNILGQPTREDEHYLIGRVGAGNTLADAMKNRQTMPYDHSLLLAHDKSLLVALSKLKADLEFGIGLEENPFASAS